MLMWLEDHLGINFLPIRFAFAVKEEEIFF
jgi:hypothetical protein